MTDNIRKQTLDAAAKAVNGERNLNYGEPEDNFSRIARLINAHLENRFPQLPGSVILTGADVAMIGMFYKQGRLANDMSHQDSWIDIAGYAACGAEVSCKKE